MHKLFCCTATLLVILLTLVGCRSARRGEPIIGPSSISDPAVARGRLVFQQHCHQCHPGGEGGLGPALNNKPAPAFLIKTQVRLGLGAMPGFEKERIDSEELDDLTTYIIWLRRAR
jgi:mono/diheme cytochrome c family protein